MAESITFSVASIPEDAAPMDTAPADPISEPAGYYCEVCGVPLSYGGRGRPPKRCAEHKSSKSSGSSSRGGGRRSTRDVDAAMAALDAAHTSLTFGLMLLSPTAAAEWEQGRPKLNERNQLILESDPALAKRIASMAAKGGSTALILNHLIALVPVLGIARGEMRERALVKKAARQGNLTVDDPGQPTFDFPDYQQATA